MENKAKANIGPFVGWFGTIFVIIKLLNNNFKYQNLLEIGADTTSFWVSEILLLCLLFIFICLIRGHKKIEINNPSKNYQNNSYQNNQNQGYGNHSAGTVDKNTLYSNGDTIYAKTNQPIYRAENSHVSNGFYGNNVADDVGKSFEKVFLVFFALGWFGFLVIFDLIAFATGETFLFIFSIPFWIVGATIIKSIFSGSNK